MRIKSTYTKLVATIGPASESYEMIHAIIEGGARVLRLNFSHGAAAEQQVRYDRIRAASKELGIPVAVFQDLQGPKIRIGSLQEDSFRIERGDTLVITTDPCIGTREKISIDYPYLHEEISPGCRILIDDGLIALEAMSISGHEITCVAAEGGLIKPRKGVNLPDVPLKHLSSFTEKDEVDLAFAFENDLDYVALSFVRRADDTAALRKFMRSRFGREIPIISKIEKPEAVTEIEGIIAQSSVIMVARGDLGVEVAPEKVPLIQKSLIRACLSAGVPVITATQMLESMMQNPRPTRAETNDVANAVLDGTSAVMLSGETAAGAYPLEAVKQMRAIAEYTEQSLEFQRLVLDQRLNWEHVELKSHTGTTEAVGIAARELALAIGASYIACFTHSGGTARLISKFRPGIPILAFSPVLATVQRLALSWGVTPILIDHLASVDALQDYAYEYLTQNKMLTTGQKAVLTAGVPVGRPGKTNMIKVIEVLPNS
jgi:pyruvate kinase